MWDLVAIFAIAFAGGVLPLLVRWSDRQLHTVLALATGIFLGAVFLDFLPALSSLEIAAEAQEHAHEEQAQHTGHAHSDDTWLWLCVLAGVLGVYLLEALVLRQHDHDDRHRHKAVGYAALLGLAAHSLTTGVSYGVVRDGTAVSSAFLVAILAHKGFETFSLTTVFLLAESARAKILAMLVAFALVTPAGILVGTALTDLLGTTGSAVMTALAAGTFLYVCLCELLVEVFHHREDGLRKVVLLAVGIGLMVVFQRVGH